jgi:hypothetical protein
MDSKIKMMFAKDPKLAHEFAEKTKKVKVKEKRKNDDCGDHEYR